jgi:xanthine dehydrogenase FAD-binding subunit
MIPHFDFIRPRTLDEALTVLNSNIEPPMILAGGTDVITGMQQGDERFCKAQTLLDIHHLTELRGIEKNAEGWRFGSAVTFSEIASHPAIISDLPLLAQAAASIGSVQIRNRATIAGNFVNNAACADSVPPLLVYDAQVHIQSAKSERIMPLAEFLLAPNRTALHKNELVTELRIPALPAGYSGKYHKLGRRRGIAISRITLAVLLKQKNSVVEDIRLASGAVTPIGARFFDLEARLRGQKISDELFASTAQELGEAILERTGLRWSSPYKLPVVQQMLFGLLCDLTAGERS